LFNQYCAHCHGPEGLGGRGVNLTTGQYRHGGSDRELFKTIKKGVEGTEMPGSPLADNEIWKVVAFVRRLGAAGAEEKATGDPEAGRKIYETKGGCAQCHFVNGRGGGLGPELSEIGLRRSLKFLHQSLTDPNAHVGDDYRTVTLVTAGGQSITGVLLNEDDYSIQVREMGGNLRSLGKSGLKDIKRESRSLMPSYASMLSAADLENMVAYLSSLRGKK